MGIEPTPRLLAHSVLFNLALPAAAMEVSKCQPLFPVFCQNIHIGCTGHTTLQAVGFSVTLSGQQALVRFDNGDRAAAEMTVTNGEKILRFHGSQNWIRIETDGRYSHRVYRDKGALMSLGQCQTAATGS